MLDSGEHLGSEDEVEQHNSLLHIQAPSELGDLHQPHQPHQHMYQSEKKTGHHKSPPEVEEHESWQLYDSQHDPAPMKPGEGSNLVSAMRAGSVPVSNRTPHHPDPFEPQCTQSKCNKAQCSAPHSGAGMTSTAHNDWPPPRSDSTFVTQPSYQNSLNLIVPARQRNNHWLEHTAQDPGCDCVCGHDRQCPTGNCRFGGLEQGRLTGYQQEPQSASSIHERRIGWLIEKIAIEHSARRTSQVASPAQPMLHPELAMKSVEQPREQTPIAQASSPLPPLEAISRPDTPRPVDYSIRQSIEREMPPPRWHRESTPAYQDRSPSPSPVSYMGDVQMHDVPMTHHRPKIPIPTSSPDPLSSPVQAVTAPQTPIPPSSQASFQHYESPIIIPAPPIPSSPLKPAKRGRRKSAVQGSKVEKSKKPERDSEKYHAEAGKSSQKSGRE